MSVEAVVIAAVRQAPRHPDPHPPLYALRVSSSLHEELKQALRASLRTSKQLTSLACAGFCLYAAGEFCRSHDGGPWKWETVLTPIGLVCGPQELYEIVERGLEHWHREVISTSSGRRFLTTLACEGGLPLGLLRHDHTSLTRYFRRLLLESERFPNESVLEIAEREEITLLLPATLRQEQVYRLATELITPIRAVRRQLPDGTSDPLAAADERIPGWRERLPITVNEKVVDELLRGLLRERRVSDVGAEVISVQCSLNVQTATIHRVLVAPPEAGADELAQLLRVRASELPMRFRIYAQGAGGERQPIAVATRFQDRYQLERFSIGDFDSAERVTVVAFAGPRRVSEEVPVPGGDPLPTDAPWIFTDDDGSAQRMLGAGSLSTRRQSVLIAAPKDTDVATVSGDEPIVVGVSAESRSVVRLRGDADISGPDDTWRLRLATQAEEMPEFRIRGATLRLGASGSNVFVGCPQVWSSDEGRYLLPSELEWKPSATPGASWRSFADSPLGDIVLRDRRATGTRFRTRVTVMPSTFSVGFERGDRPGQGVLFLRNLRSCQVSVIGDACSCEQEQIGNDLRVTFATSARPPRTVPVELRFASLCKAQVTLSYPEERHDFLRWSGEPLEWNSRITLPELNHLRAVVQTPRPGRLYVLRGELWRTSEGRRSRGDVPYELRELQLGELQRIGDGELELPLDAVRGELEAALAVMDDLNAEVRLKIRAEGETDPGGRYIAVSRCPSRLTTEIRADGFTIGVDPPDRVVGIKLVAMSMRDNMRVREELPQTATGWLFSTAEREPGSWLIACSERRTDAPRPVFITVHRGTVRPDDHTLRELQSQREVRAPSTFIAAKDGGVTLGDASNLGEPERTAAIRGIVAGCAKSYAHPAWPSVLSQLEALKFVPAEGLILPRELARSPQAVTRALFLRPQLIDVLWDELETLPFLWMLVPLRAWLFSIIELPGYFVQRRNRIAAELGADAGNLLDDPGEEARRRVAEVFARLERRAPYARVIYAGIYGVLPSNNRPFDPPTQPLQTLTKAEFEELRQRVLRIDRVRWPTCDWESLADRVDRQLRAKLFTKTAGFTRPVLNAPLIAAWHTANSALPATDVYEATDAGLTLKDKFDLRRFIAFDEDWFERAYTFHLAQLLGL